MWRRELKYPLDQKSLVQFVASCETRFGFVRKYTERGVSSLYFDTYDNEFIMANLSGLSQRVKLRLRWYKTAINDFHKPTLEFKIRSNILGKKSNMEMNELDNNQTIKTITNLCNTRARENGNSARYLNYQPFTPTLLIQYTRQYYENINGLRLTVDRDIKCTIPGDRIIDSDYFWTDFGYKLAEIKIQTNDSKDGMELLQSLPFKNKRHSKYMMGLHLQGRLNYF